MDYNLTVKSIPDLNRKLRFFLKFNILTLFIVFFIFLYFFFESYDKQTREMAISSLDSKVSSFVSFYESQIIAIASQPVFRNLLGADENMLKTTNINNPFFFGLKRQIASLSAKYKKNTIFEGTILFNKYNKIVLSQGKVDSPYSLSFKLCYRDSTLSYSKGAPCIGTWKFFINKEKLKRNLVNHNFKISSKKGNNIKVQNLFKFEFIPIEKSAFQQDLFFQLNTNNTFVKSVFIFMAIIFFITLLLLYRFIIDTYRKNYFDNLFKIHNNLSKNINISKEEYKNSPDEILNFIDAINKALKIRRFEAIESLAHDLRSPLNRLKSVATKLDTPHKTDVLSIHTQCFLALNKVHNIDIESVDTKKAIQECVFSIYIEHYQSNTIQIEYPNKPMFCKASYSHLIRIISNMVGNSLAALHEKEGKQIKIKLQESIGFIELIIKDNGIGISKENLNYIFKEGFSLKDSSGLGLYYCKNKIESWGGKVTCESKKGKGTLFNISIPKSNAPFDFIEYIYHKKSSNFIIIDDDYFFHNHLSNKLLSDQKVTHIYNTEDLFSFFKLGQINSNSIFLVDYHFDESLNGIDIIKKYGLGGKAYLISSAADSIRERYSDLRAEIPIISKNHINTFNLFSVENIDAVIVDDDVEILEDSKEIASLKETNLLCLNNFLQLRMVISLLNKTTPIYLDDNIDNTDEKGTNLAEYLYKKEHFSQLFLHTGAIFESKPSFINKIILKGALFDE